MPNPSQKIAPQMPPTENPVHHDRLAQLLGISILELAAGRAKLTMTATADHCNGLGIVHGATLFALADVAFAAAANSHGHPTVGINASISYLKAAHPGPLFAEASEDHNAKIGLYHVRITNAHGILLALFQGLSYRKS